MMFLMMAIINGYCKLLGDSDQWGNAKISVLIQLFRSVIDEFNNLVGVSPSEPLFVQRGLLGHPRIERNKNGCVVSLSAKGHFWSKYVYEFAHEYCHYLIGVPMESKKETTFWFEETICNLASLTFLRRMAVCWKAYDLELVPNKQEQEVLSLLKTAAPNNEMLLQFHLNENPRIDKLLPDWIESKMPILSQPEYQREMYNQMAVVLFDLFEKNPDLWRVIPYLSRPSLDEYTDFRSFITRTLSQRITIEIEHFPLFVKTLTGDELLAKAGADGESES